MCMFKKKYCNWYSFIWIKFNISIVLSNAYYVCIVNSMITNYSNEYCFSCLLSLLVILFRPLNASFIGQWTAKCTYSVPRIINGYMSFCICSINNKSITVRMQTNTFSETTRCLFIIGIIIKLSLYINQNFS